MTAVEWLYKNLLENPMSNQDVEYNEAVFHNAKEMEKQQIIDAIAWVNKVSYRSFDGNWYLTQENEDIKKTTEELLEIYKKEQNL